MSQTMAVSTSLRRDIADGLHVLLEGVIDPETGAPLYQAVQLGAFFAPQVYAAWAEVTFTQGRSTPSGAGIGWRIEDVFTLAITSGWDYEADASVAMRAMLHAQDVLLPLLHSHVRIPSPTNPGGLPIASVWSVLEDAPDRAVPVRLPVGRVYLLWNVYVQVKQQYSIVLV